MKRQLQFAIFLFGALAAPYASASLLLDPTGGASVGFPGVQAGEHVSRSINGTFNFYGSNITSLHLSESGFVGVPAFAGLFADRSIGVLADAAGGPVIAPLYDFLGFGPGTSVTDQSVANTYYAVTYQSMYEFGDTTVGRTSDFQVILFMATTDIGGFQFHAGDIAFSYGNLNHQIDGTFTVGVAQSPTNTTGNQTTADGQLTDFSTMPTGSMFLLYRPVQVAGDTGVSTVYDVLIETTSATPEPASIALSVIGLAALVWLKLRREGANRG